MPGLGLSACVLLAACADIGGIASHRLPVDARQLDGGEALGGHTAADGTPLSVAGWPQAQWWSGFGDTQLDALIARAVAGNPHLKAAQDRVDSARAATEAAEDVLGPGVDAEGLSRRLRYSSNHIFPAPLGGGEYWENQLNLKFIYNFDIWGGDRQAVEAALGRQRASELEARAARLALESAVVRAYVDYSLACALHEELEAEVEQRRQIIDLTRRLREAGLVADLQLSQVQAQLPLLHARLDASESAIEQSRYALAALAGEGPGAGEMLGTPALSLEAALDLPQAAPAVLIGRRPDVVAQRWRVEAAGHGVEAMRTRFYPNFDLHGLIGLQALSFNKLLQPDSAAWELGPAFTLPYFRGEELRARLHGSTAQFDLAVDAYDAAVIGALHEAADALSARRGAEAQNRDTRDAVDAAQRAYDQAHEGFEAGLTGYLDVLQAQTALFTAREALVRSSAARLQTQAALMQALGGGFDEQLEAQTQAAHSTPVDATPEHAS